MPKPGRSRHEVELVRDRILDCALDIIASEGFDRCSMHRIGRRIGMTAANLYNYFANKDRLFIGLHKKAFERLYRQMAQAVAEGATPAGRVKNLLAAYIDFGTRNPACYDLMFNRPVRQHASYKETEEAGLSHDEYSHSMRCFYLAVETLRQFVPDEYTAGSGPKGQVLRLWGELHGLVSLHNSGILAEVVQHPGPFLEQAVADAIVAFQPTADRKPVTRKRS